MRIPRDWSGDDLIKRLERVGYHPTRQSGSHVRLTYQGEFGEHHITVPRHRLLRIGSGVIHRKDNNEQELLSWKVE